MIRIINPDKWGKADYGWLKANYLYSFANYYDPDRMGFGALRVVNHDIVDAGKGFDPHPHSDMEIVTIPLEGSLHHADTLGNHGVIHVGELQHMSAGSGIIHAEVNTATQSSRVFQIWIEPDTYHREPRYQQQIITNEPYLIRKQVTLTRYILKKQEKKTFSSLGKSLCLLIGHGSLSVQEQQLPQGTAIEIDADSPDLIVLANEDATLYVITQQTP